MSRTDLLAAALAYHGRGWCVIPVSGKAATVRWERYQTKRPAEATLRRWFGSRASDSVTGVAGILGPVSGDLVVRDFDTIESYAAFETLHGDLAATLPRSKTHKGFHVFFRASVDGAKHLGDGELRGARSYVVLPPSSHPDGGAYRWEVEPGESIPEIDPALFLREPATERQRNRETEIQRDGDTEAIVAGVVESLLDDPRIIEAIEATIPHPEHKRNRTVFQYARRLQAIPELAGVPLLRLDPLVRKWHERAKPHIGTKEYAETQADFAYGWGRVRVPYGEGLIKLWEASEGEVPEGLETLTPPLARLAAFCRRLSNAGGEAPFYLSCRKLAKLRGDSKDTAYRDLQALVGFGVLEVAKRGTIGAHGTATRYRYLWSHT
jgi:hypothetical protein